MENINKRSIPELSSSNRKNRKKRNVRGQNVVGWEKLRERQADAPVSVDGVGLVSAHYSYSGSGAGKELDLEEVVPKRVTKKKRRRTIVDSEELAILNPPPTPAGSTVTSLGGGIIPEVTNGDINKYAITGKAMPRIGRRILNNAKITGDQNPLTRDDANNNGLIFDGTSREMPDPTPEGPITGAMGIVDKFKKGKDKKPVVKTNNTPFNGVNNLIKEQANQVIKFENWASTGNWSEFHKQHFDWWTFPIDRGSAGYGFRYDISGTPLEDLKGNPEYIQSLRRATELYMRSMAWDLKKRDWISNPDFDAGQDPTNNINGARLFKIARSLQLHGLSDEFESTRGMAQSLRSAGYRIGNENFWNNPDGFHMRSSHLKNGGITGAMATGLGINPTTFKTAINGKPRYDTSKEPWFIAKWIKRDKDNQEFFTRGIKNDKSALTFWWKDEATRLDYIDKHKRGKLTDGFANFAGHSYDNARTGMGFSTRLDKLSKQIEQLGLMWGTTGGTHGGMYDPFGGVFTHSSSSSNQAVSEANQARDLLGHFSKEINPSQYWDRYWSWINNPHVTAKDKNGRDIGIRLAFNDDKDKLVEEFDRRIKKLEDDIRSSYGLKPVERLDGGSSTESDNYSNFPEHILKSMLDRIDDKDNEAMSQAMTLKHITDELRDAITSYTEKPEDLTKSMVLKMLEEKRPDFLKERLAINENFAKENVIDSAKHSTIIDMRQMLQIQHDIDIAEGRNPADLDIAQFKKEHYPNEDVATLKEIHKQEIEKLDKQ